MKFTLKAGIALTALTGAVAMTGTAFAADLGAAPRGGSMKDGYVEAMPQIVRGPAGPCYFRADVGYAKSGDADIKWAQTDPDPASATFGDYLTSDVRTLNFDNTWFGEVGAGCGSGSRGLRAELMFGIHGSRKIDGEPATAWFIPAGPPPVTPEDDPLHTSVKSYTMMFNAYKDLGSFGGMTPYVGAGIGASYNMTQDVYFTGNPALVNTIHGDNDLSFAWALMAGVGYQVTDRAILDFGYRYIDLGKAGSQNGDSAGNWNPRVNIDDLTSHEFKVGLRYHFGSGDCCAQQYVPMK
jgi:opacity protein-like surface antigen